MSPDRTLSTQKLNTSILSQSTILILSGYLVGIAASQTTSIAMQFSIHAAGMTGFVAYIALRYLTHQQQILRHEKRQKAEFDLELRFDRHVPRFRPRRQQQTRRNHHDDYRQYLTVTTSNRPVRRANRTISSR